MLRTLIVDDEFNARQVIKNILELYCPQVELVGEAENVDEGVQQIRKLNPDLLLLDIHMPDGTGFDVLSKSKGNKFGVIFITAHEQCAIQAIKKSALDYIIKPINANELIQAVEKANLEKTVTDNDYSKAESVSFAATYDDGGRLASVGYKNGAFSVTYTYSATTQQVKNQINAGTNFAIYSGHGAETEWADGPVFTQSDVASLTNTRYPFVASFACLTGK